MLFFLVCMLRYLRAGWERTVCSTSYSFEDIEEFGAIARDWRGTRATFRRRGREDFLSSLGLARADLLLIGWISLNKAFVPIPIPGLICVAMNSSCEVSSKNRRFAVRFQESCQYHSHSANCLQAAFPTLFFSGKTVMSCPFVLRSCLKPSRYEDILPE